MTNHRASSRGAGIIAALLVLLAFAGCTGTPTTPPQPGDETATAQVAVRTDHDPLSTRFPKLGEFSEAHWVGHAAGVDSGRVPGPTDVVIAGFVRLPPEELARATAGYAWTPTPAGWESTVPVVLRPYQPAGGDWRQSEPYAAEVRTTAYAGPVYLDLNSGTVFLDLISA